MALIRPYEVLKDQAGLRPAPYLASRGMKWIQHYAAPGLNDDELKDYLRESYRIVPRQLHLRIARRWDHRDCGTATIVRRVPRGQLVPTRPWL